MKNGLVFDLGFLNGEDTSRYLSEDFDVVAVEANPLLCDSARREFEHEIAVKRLILYNRAVAPPELGSIDFFVNKERPEVSSTERWIAEQNGIYSVQQHVLTTIDLQRLIMTHGTPYYMKVDIEGMDKEISRQLQMITYKPQYVSFELNKVDYLEIFMNLKIAGYTRFQLINQIHNEPNCSGDFGEFLNEKNWIGLDEAIVRYLKYRELKMIDNVNLGVGWIDLHAKLL